jgi:Fic family protein
MKHVPLNIKYLCEYHHTGNLGVHHHPEVDRKYKEELQLQLTLILTKDYYTHSELKNILNASDNTIKAILKTLPKYKEGVKITDLIIHMMGDENYL